MLNLKIDFQQTDEESPVFEPLLDMRSGICFGLKVAVKASPGGLVEAGTDPGKDLFLDRRLTAERRALGAAVADFLRTPENQNLKLFIELDCELPINSRDWTSMLESDLVSENPQLLDSVCIILTGNSLADPDGGLAFINRAKTKGISIAIKAPTLEKPGLDLLVKAMPDFLYLDGWLIAGSNQDPRWAGALSSLINLAHRLGASVAVGGVDSKELFYHCRTLGCDLSHGDFIAPPLTRPGEERLRFDHIIDLISRDQRHESGDHRFIESHMALVAPINGDTRPIEALNVFKDPDHPVFVPVVNSKEEPLGLVMESTLKPFAYSRYGKYILENPTINRSLMDFIVRCPLVELQSPIDEVLEIYVKDDSLPGVIVVDRMKYAGFLDARSLLKALNERNLAQARDQSPLTKLPGNSVINDYLAGALRKTGVGYTIVYFDLDNFKPYNDKYGFRQGDRVLIMFSEILKAGQHREGYFCGHIGGDDFFLGMEGWNRDQAFHVVSGIVDKFAHDVRSFYTAGDRAEGCISAPDRNGVTRCFPILTVSAAVIHFPVGRAETGGMNELSKQIAELKNQAKKGPEKVAMADVGTDPNRPSGLS